MEGSEVTVTSAEGDLGKIGPDLMKIAEIIGDKKSLIIKQKVDFLEAATQGAYEAANKYKISAADNEEEAILHAKAYGPCCERMFCAPFHSLVLKISDPKTGQVHLSIERPGFGSGKYCMRCCCACHDGCCNDGVVVHEGDVDHKQGNCCGITVENQDKAISKILQSNTMTPQLDVYAEVDSAEPYASITGPCCFGGCSEMCCSSEFKYQKGDTPIATMTKLAPKTCGECCTECCTDADRFSVNFEDNIEAEEKANSLAAVFLSDYMFFEMDNGMITFIPGGCKFTFFQCYCFGCLLPCSAECKNDKVGGGAPATVVTDAREDKNCAKPALPAAEPTSVESMTLDRSI